MTKKEKRDINRKLKVLNYPNKNITQICRYFDISRTTYYKWLKRFKTFGEKGLIDSKPCPENPNLRVPKEIEEKIIYIRKNYHFGPERISWYLQKYHNIKVSTSGVYYVLKRNYLNILPRNAKKRTPKIFKRYEKQMPGHHVQVDVKFLKFQDKNKNTIQKYQYTAIDDATRIRALKIYKKHNQANAIDFINYVVKKFPFRIHTIRTDNGHEFQLKFHSHCYDLGLNHTYIKPGTPRLNGKVERSHSTDEVEFYQLLSYNGDVDLNKKLKIWENFYNFERPHFSLQKKSPYEVLKEKLNEFC